MIKRIMGGVTASALALLGFTSAAQAQTVQTAQPAGPEPASHVANLHQAYLRALPKVKTGTISGITYALGKAPKARAASPRASGCAEPNCPLAYGGGPVQHNPKVYLLLWGHKWSTNSHERASAKYLERFYSGLGVQPKDNWSAITAQYTDASGFPLLSGSVYMGVYQDSSTPPTGVGQTGLQAEADAFATAHKLTGDVNAQIVIATQSGTCPSGFYAPNCAHGSGYYCAWHSNSPTTGVTFTNLPYLLDAGSGCGENFVNGGSRGTNDGWSIVGGHEYAETITDPQPTSGWYDANDTVSGGEIGDKCAWGGQLWGTPDPSGDVALSTGSFAMQSLWSNAAGRCVMASAEDSVSVTSPGNQDTAPGAPVSLQIGATSSSRAPLEYGASGLPKGLSISSSGLITGDPSTGAYTVRVAAGDTTGAVGAATFSWTVGNPVIKGLITGYKHRCVQDYRARTRNGNKIDIWGCTHYQRRAETWTMGSGNSLQIRGKCLTDPNNGKAGAHVLLEKCTGAKDQIWHHRANGEWAVASHYLCLTVPNRDTRDGTQLVAASCRHTVTQRWSSM